MMRFAVLCIALGGCLAKDLDAIAIQCDTDDQCPTNAFCEAELHECRSTSDGTMPMLTFGGLGRTSSGPFAASITLPATDVTIFDVELVNSGTAELDVDYEITGPACLDVTSLSNGTSKLEAGEAFIDEADIDPDAGCASPAAITIKATANRREFDFAATIKLQ